MDVPYDDELRVRLRHHLADHDVRSHDLEGRRHAAVAVVVVDSDAEEHGSDPTPTEAIIDLSMIPGDVDGLDGRVDGTAGGAAVLLTRRQPRMRSHAGQWALPGGRVDDGEDPLAAALREVREEIGLELDETSLLGRLDDYPTRSGYVISPFVLWAGLDAAPEPNPEEVASIHRIALRELLRPDSPRFIEIPESERPVIQLPIGRDLLHAPTGAVLHQFRAVAYEGRTVRVDRFEQPVFAWR